MRHEDEAAHVTHGPCLVPFCRLEAEPGNEDTFREAAVEVEVAAAGRVDCVVWWTECDMGVRNHWSSAPSALWMGPEEALPYGPVADPAHVWQQASFVRGAEGAGRVAKGDRVTITAYDEIFPRPRLAPGSPPAPPPPQRAPRLPGDITRLPPASSAEGWRETLQV